MNSALIYLSSNTKNNINLNEIHSSAILHSNFLIQVGSKQISNQAEKKLFINGETCKDTEKKQSQYKKEIQWSNYNTLAKKMVIG